jgi:hypothetical protein
LDESILFPKNFVKRDGYKFLEFKNEVCDYNKFNTLGDELRNEEISVNCIVEKFINTTDSIAKDLYCFQSVKYLKYK